MIVFWEFGVRRLGFGGSGFGMVQGFQGPLS